MMQMRNGAPAEQLHLRDLTLRFALTAWRKSLKWQASQCGIHAFQIQLPGRQVFVVISS